MKTLKIAYWASTCLFCGVFFMTGTLYLLHAQSMVTKFHEIGFPLYILNLIGSLKIVGAITLLVPRAYPELKEWAYAGFVFDLVGAAWCHFCVQGFGQGIKLLIPITVVAVSYLTYHRLNDSTGSRHSDADEPLAA